MNITIIGSGITGITTAYYCAKYSHNVTIYDERRYPAMATSYANGGQISASNSETWNSWENIRKASKWLLKKDAPLLISIKPDIEKITWLLKFIQAIPSKESNTYKTCEMAIKSNLIYNEIINEENIEFDCVKKGILHIFNNEKELQKARIINKIYNKAGLKRWEVSPNEIKKIEPMISKKSIVGGFYNTLDFTGDIHKFCMELNNILIDKYKVKIIKKHISNIDKYINDCDALIVCAGTGSRKIAKSIKDNLSIYPVKGYSITINYPGENSPWVSLLDEDAKIVTSRLGPDRLRIAGTAELCGYNTDIRWDRIRPLIKWAEHYFPEINTEDIKPWAGLRPMTPNMMPIIGQSPNNKKVYYNTGHGHLGWTLSAYTAKAISNYFK